MFNTNASSQRGIRAAFGARSVFLLCFTLILVACSNTFNPLEDYEELNPATILVAPTLTTQAMDVRHGQYLVELLGCGTCHTDGALVGAPNQQRLMAGSGVGIAFSTPFDSKPPGVVFPANLTPDKSTGVGNWNKQQLAAMIRTGVDRHGRQQLPVMPWPAYARISQPDAEAIAAYLLALPAVTHKVPKNTYPGQYSSAPFVHFGVYRSRN